MRIGKYAPFTLEVNPNGGATRDPDDYIDERSPEERPSCHGRELLQFARRKAANETGGAAGGIPSENSRAHHQPSGSGALWLLHLFRRETGAGAGCGRTFLFDKLDCKSAGKAISVIMLAQNPVTGDVAR